MKNTVKDPISFNKAIKKRNAYFSGLTTNEKKVFVARDILNIVTAERGDRYVDNGYGYKLDSMCSKDSTGLQEVLLNNERVVQCSGCVQALAALCSIRSGDSISSDQLAFHSEDLRNITHTLGTFKHFEMLAMEAVYEKAERAYLFTSNKTNLAQGIEYLKLVNDYCLLQYRRSEHKFATVKYFRIILLMESIIESGGYIFGFKYTAPDRWTNPDVQKVYILKHEFDEYKGKRAGKRKGWE